LYALGALKNPAFKLLGEIKLDEKYFWALKLLGSSMGRFVKLCCPRVYRITDIETNMDYGYPVEETGAIMKPPMVDNSYDSMSQHEMCIIDNGDFIFLYVGSSISSNLIYDIFGYEDWNTIHYHGISTLETQMDTDAYQRIINITEQLRSENDGTYQPIQVVLDGSMRQKQLKLYAMIEDTMNKNREFTYSDFMAHLHTLIRMQ